MRTTLPATRALMAIVGVAINLALLGACRTDADIDDDDDGDDGDVGGAGDEGGSGDDGDDGGTGDDGSSGSDDTGDEGVFALTDAHNYRYQGTLDAESTPVASLSDITIDWSLLTEDIQCHDLDPVADIDNVVLLLFRDLTEEEVEQGLSEDSLEQADVGVYLSQEPGEATSVQLADFTFFGTDADIEKEFTEGSGTWLITFATGTSVGVGTRMLTFIEPLDGETTTTAVVDEACDVLEYEVDIASAETATVTQAGPWSMDWSSITQTGQGTEFEPTKVSSVMVAWYADLSVADLESQFVDLELVADRTWTLEHESGSSADLSALRDVSDGAAFEGFDASAGGTWILALRCLTCPNPAPLMLTVLEPAD